VDALDVGVATQFATDQVPDLLRVRDGLPGPCDGLIVRATGRCDGEQVIDWDGRGS